MSSESAIVVTAVPTNVSTEGAVGVSDIVHYLQPTGQGMKISGVLNVTAGTGTTAVALRCRKGSGTSGAQVGNTVSHTLAAGASASIAYEFVDVAPIVDPVSTPTGSPPQPANQYTVTIQQTGGTGAGTTNYGTIGLTPVAAGW